MNILCENPCQTCVPFVGGASSPADPDYPFINLSSESPDVDRFFGRRYTPPGWRPPLGDNWYAIGCLGFCVSDVSQEEADLCALQQATICLSVNWPNVVPNPNGPFPPFVEEPRELFGNNPQFCQFLCPDGQPFTFTTAAGIFVAFSQATADIMAYTYACNKAVENRICMGTLSPAYACVGTEYVGSLEASSGNLPVTFGLVGDLPPGYVMSQNMSTLFINGSTEDAGDYAFTITATDTLGNVMQKPTTLTVFGIVNPSQLPDATLNEAYSLNMVTGGTVSGSITFAIISGALPTGLALNTSTGEITGTPTVEGAYQFTVRTTSSSIVCDKVFDLFVQPAASLIDFAFTNLATDLTELSSASVNGFDYLLGLPLDGTLLGPDLEWLWTVSGGGGGYGMIFQIDSPIVEDGTYRVTINNAAVVPVTVSNPAVQIFINGGFVGFYLLALSTGPQDFDLPMVVGDTLTLTMGADGSAAPAGSYQVNITTVKLP